MNKKEVFMVNKNERTVEKYLLAGAWMRLAKFVEAMAFDHISGLIPSAMQAANIRKVEKGNSQLSSDAENQMFTDFPLLSNDYLNVFYGSIDTHRYNSQVDKEIHEIIDGILTLLAEMNGIKTPETENFE